MHLCPRGSQPSLNLDTRAVHCVVSWRRCTVHLPAAPHPSRNPGLELAATTLSQSRVFSAAALRHAGVPAYLAGRSRLLHPPELRSLDGSALWIDPLGRLRDVWRGAAAVVYRRRCLRSGVVARRGTRMARVPVSPAGAAARLPRRLPDLRVDLGRVALSRTPLDRLQAGHKAHLLPRL